MKSGSYKRPVARRNAVWSEVERVAARGEVPLVQLSPAARVDNPEPGWARRKRTLMRTPAGQRMRCRNPSCRRRIKAGEESIVCCEKCRRQLLEYTRSIVDVLEGRASALDFPTHYRSFKLKRVFR